MSLSSPSASHGQYSEVCGTLHGYTPVNTIVTNHIRRLLKNQYAVRTSDILAAIQNRGIGRWQNWTNIELILS